jgi:hypothetical protein
MGLADHLLGIVPDGQIVDGSFDFGHGSSLWFVLRQGARSRFGIRGFFLFVQMVLILLYGYQV